MDPVVQIDTSEVEAIAADLRRVSGAMSQDPRQRPASVPSAAGGVVAALAEIDRAVAQLSALTGAVADASARHLESRVVSVHAADQLAGSGS